MRLFFAESVDNKTRLARGPAPLIVRLLAVLAISGVFAALSACGSSSDKSVLANRKDPTAIDDHDKAIASPADVSSPLTVPEGTPIHVRLLNSISSASASAGEECDGTLGAPIEVGPNLAFPRGVRVRVRVVDAKPSGRLHDSGTLRLTLSSIATPSGKWIPVTTTSVRVRGKNHNRRNLTLIGGGAGVGALIGGIAGGGKGAAIGAASGAAAGTAGAYATGRKEATLSAEAKLTFRTLNQIVLNE